MEDDFERQQRNLEFARQQDRQREHLKQDIALNEARDAALRREIQELAYRGSMGAVFTALGIPVPAQNRPAPPPQAIAADYVKRAVTEEDAGNYARAIDYINKALPLSPSDAPFLYTELAMCYHGLQRYADAERYAEHALRADARHTAAYYWRALARLYLGREQDALSDLNTVIDRVEGFPYAFSYRGSIRMGRKEFLEAESDFSKAIAIAPATDLLSDSYLSRGLCRSHLNHFDDALSDFQTAIGLFNNELSSPLSKPRRDTIEVVLPFAYVQKGIVNSALKNSAAALSDLRQAITLKSDYADAYKTLGYYYRGLGDEFAAVPNFLRAARLDEEQGNAAGADEILRA
jgi:tetratricopeptide (TPR) repeat protein